MDRSHVVFPFDSVIDEYSTARVVNNFVLCRKNKKNQQQMLVFGQWKKDEAGSDVQRRLFGFTVMVACLIYYEIWNAVPNLSRELEEDRHVLDPVADQRRNSVLNASVQV